MSGTPYRFSSSFSCAVVRGESSGASKRPIFDLAMNDRVSLRIDVERSDGELCERRGQTTERQDDAPGAARVERTGNEVLVTNCADVEPASTGVQVRLCGDGCHENAEREIAVETADAGAQIAVRVAAHRGHPA